MLITEEFKVGTPVIGFDSEYVGTVVGYCRRWSETRYHSGMKLFIMVEYFNEDGSSIKEITDAADLSVFKE